jgi:aminoglycoside phosphotransferase (APT) family kinase protein
VTELLDAHRALVLEWCPDIVGFSFRPVGEGWDSYAYLVDDAWIVRLPRRPEVAARLLTEPRLLPWLAPQLPAAVPVPDVVSPAGGEPFCVRHRIVRGEPVSGGFPTALGLDLGRFLAALHTVPADGAVVRGVPDALTVREAVSGDLASMRARVLPLLDPADRRLGAELLDQVATFGGDRLVHADLGPDHVLEQEGRLSGVIDWSDARVGDPAIDLAWALHATPPNFAQAAQRSYGGVDADTLTRSHAWYRLGPWHEVLYGLDESRPDLVVRGLSGVRARLAPSR